jgi:broad specificity phosphatase PhoE
LSDTGRARAGRLAQLLTDEPLTAAYATAYRRTQQTAQPAADRHGIVVTTYDAKMPDAAFASQLRITHARGTVLVVGHSNSVPGIVAALSGAAVEAMQDNQFDRIYQVSIGPDGKATLSQRSY